MAKGKGRSQMRIVTEFRGREIKGAAAEKLRLEAAIGLEVTRILASRVRAGKAAEAPDIASIRHAVDVVEARIVEALWTLARLPEGRRPDGPNHHGVEYIHDRADRWSLAVASGGKWDQPAPRPPLPSGRAIDAMYAPLEWLSLVPKELGKLLTAAALTKRGDAARQVSWARVLISMPELTVYSKRTLQRRYEDAVRTIVAELAAGGGK